MTDHLDLPPVQTATVSAMPGWISMPSEQPSPEIDEEATERAVQASTDTLVEKASGPPLPYFDLPADHPANIDAIAKAQAVAPLRLNLASGTHVIDGFENVDMYADVKHKVNLLTFPWPWETSSVDELISSHFIEHIPMCYWSPGRDYALVARDEHDRDLWCLFMDEAWRVLKPGGIFTVIWPALQHVRAFQDPTHRRFIPIEQMFYLQREFRRINGLQHYLGQCDFQIDGPRTLHSYPIDEATGRTDEAIAGMIKRNWNFATDAKATLIAKK